MCNELHLNAIRCTRHRVGLTGLGTQSVIATVPQSLGCFSAYANQVDFMFRNHNHPSANSYRRPISVILAFNAAALLITIWVMTDLVREQDLMGSLLPQLPPAGAAFANELAGELRWQFRLSVLLVINLIATALSVVMLWRAYHVSQESLRDVRAQASDILSSMDQALITTDLDGQITSINQHGYELLTIEDGVGRYLDDYDQLQEIAAYRRQSMQGCEPIRPRNCEYQSKGTRLELRVYCQPLRNRAEVEIGSILQIRDVTVEVLTEQRMRRMERYMELGHLVAGLYHEIKNPLAALSLYLQLICEKFLPNKPEDETQEMLNVASMELKRVNGVLESFRDYASVGVLDRRVADVRCMVERQITLISPLASASAVNIDLDIPENFVYIEVDESKIEQVFLNIIKNSLEAMPSGGRLKVAIRQNNIGVQVEFEDTGNGVPETMRSRIFEPFFTTKEQGIGMGLAVCEKIVRQHGGSLSYRRLDQGSLFAVGLPYAFEPDTQDEIRPINDQRIQSSNR